MDLVRRLGGCFRDARDPRFVEHSVATLVGQRVFGVALGCEDLNDHDELRHDPLMAVLAGKLEARRDDCAPVAGKSTLNRLERSREIATRYHKISHDPAAIEALFVDLFLEAHAKAPKEIVLDLDATDDPLHGHQLSGRSSFCEYSGDLSGPNMPASAISSSGQSPPCDISSTCSPGARAATSATAPPGGQW